MRRRLLMTAVATVTAPSLLVLLAVLGHDHVTVKAPVAMTELDGTSADAFQVKPVAMRTAEHSNVAQLQHGQGTRVTVLSELSESQQGMGMRLLTGAADAAMATSYQGTELLSQAGLSGSVRMVSQVWHEGGGKTLVQTSSASAATPSRAASSSLAATVSAPEGVFGVTRPLVELIGKYYVAVYRGDGVAVGRHADVVELYRFDGSLAARYWLDRRTMVPLRRELFDTTGNLVSDDSFVSVRFGSVGNLARAARARSVTGPAWIAAVPPSRLLATLAAKGWRVPSQSGSQPGGLPLYAASWARTPSGKVVDLEYSDGLYVVSLFVQRGTLASRMSGWQPVTVAGQHALVSGHSVTWQGQGFVYTMIADTPPQTVEQVIQELPAGSTPGVIGRIGRGFSRIADLFNPFS